MFVHLYSTNDYSISQRPSSICSMALSPSISAMTQISHTPCNDSMTLLVVKVSLLGRGLVTVCIVYCLMLFVFWSLGG